MSAAGTSPAHPRQPVGALDAKRLPDHRARWGPPGLTLCSDLPPSCTKERLDQWGAAHLLLSWWWTTTKAEDTALLRLKTLSPAGHAHSASSALGNRVINSNVTDHISIFFKQHVCSMETSENILWASYRGIFERDFSYGHLSIICSYFLETHPFLRLTFFDIHFVVFCLQVWELCYYCFNISCKRTKLRAKNKKNSLIWQCISVNWHKVNGTSNSFSYSSYNVFCFCLYTELHICWCGWCGRTRGTTMSSTFFISALVCWEGNWESNLPLIWVTKSQWKVRLYRKHRNTQHCTAQGIKCLIPGNIRGKFLEKKKKKAIFWILCIQSVCRKQSHWPGSQTHLSY